MECNSYIHHFLPDEITIIDADLECLKRNQGVNFQRSRSELFSVIDRMGQLSAKAQGLSGAITTGSKMLYSDHRLYMLKDTTPSSRQVIGILKVGTKNLFIYDMQGAQHEMAPLCVLDFYVHESRQRQGCGRKLFDFMLAREGVIPRHLAIDRPSHKFLAFLEKHYRLQHAIPQMYKFVVFQGFFRERSDARGKRAANGRLGSATKNHSSPSSHKQQLQQQLQQLQQQKQQQEQEQNRPETCLLPKIASTYSSRTQRQSPTKHTASASAHVQLNGSNLVSNIKSLSIREGGAAGDQPSEPVPPSTSKLASTSLPDGRTDLRTVGDVSLNPRISSFSRYPVLNRRDAQSAPIGAAAGPTQRDVNSWTAAAVANGYTYEKGLNRNQRHTRLW